MGEIAEASYPVKVFAGVLVELMEGHLCVQFVCVRLRDKKKKKGESNWRLKRTCDRTTERQRVQLAVQSEEDFLFVFLRDTFSTCVLYTWEDKPLYISV